MDGDRRPRAQPALAAFAPLPEVEEDDDEPLLDDSFFALLPPSEPDEPDDDAAPDEDSLDDALPRLSVR